MQRVTGLPEERVLDYEAQAELILRAALQSVMDQIARRVEASMPVLASVLVAADGEPPPEPPPGQPYVSPDDLASIPPLWQQAVEAQILPVVAQVFMDAAGRLHTSMVEASSIAGLPSVGSLAAEQYLAQARNTFAEVGDDLWGTARDQLLEGFEQGESIPELAERLRQSANMTARRGVLVARTQVNEASNAGSFAVAQASGLQMKKEWIATPDLRTRPTHLAADGQRVDLNEPFIVGGFSAMFPAAPSLPPAERYNCRCTVGYVMPDRAPAQVKADDLQAKELAELPGTSGVPAEPVELGMDRTTLEARIALRDDPSLTRDDLIAMFVDDGMDRAIAAQYVDEIMALPPLPPDVLPRLASPGDGLPAYGENPPSYIRPSLRDAKTPRQLRQVWQTEAQSITGFPFLVDAMPRGISMVTAREYAEGTLQMLAQFPGAKVDRIHWFDDATSSSYAQVRRGGHAIEFNMRYASEAGRPKFLAARRRDVAGWDDPALSTSWGVRNDLSGQGVVYHEFTHILDIENGREVVHGQIVPLLIRHAQREGVTDIDDLIKRRISSYATKNYQEMVAEAGTDVMVNGAAASALSRDIFDLVRAEYRRRGFAIRTAPIDELAAEAERFGKAAAPGWQPGAWRAAPLDDAREEIAEREFEDYVKNQEQFDLAVDESYGRKLGRGIAAHELPESARAYRNGSYTIIVRDPANVSDTALRAAQNQLDALIEAAPLDGRPFVLRLGGTSSTGNAAMTGPDGISMFGELEMAPRGDIARRHRFLMPSAVERPKAVYDLTHEYGHAHMLQDPARSAGARRLYDELGLKEAHDVGSIRPWSDTLGYYGASDHLEAYAEAFAEWELSAGLTENAQVLRYAQTFGWRNPLEFPGEAFPKTAAPRALSTQTVAQLRALAKERGIVVPAGARKADLVKALEEAPSAPTQAIMPSLEVRTALSAADQARVRTLVRSDPQIFATVQDRFGPVSSSGNLSNADAAWLQEIYKRDRAFVERVAQEAHIRRTIASEAKKLGITPTQYEVRESERLKELLDGKPIAVRVRDDAALRDILSGGRFKTSIEGAKRAAGLSSSPERRQLGEAIMGADQPPIYGYVAVRGVEPALSPGRKIAGIAQREGQEDVLSVYGQIQIVLKPEIRARTTVTVGDSLDEIGFVRPSPIDAPTADSVGSARRLDDAITEPGWTRRSYVEAQIHGGLRREDIAEVVFPDTPDAATIEALRNADIPWRVLRKGDEPIFPTQAPASQPVSVGIKARSTTAYDRLRGEAKASARQADIDAATGYGDAALRLDELVANGASERALRHTIDGLTKQYGVPAADVERLRALVGQPEQLRAAMREIAGREGVEVVGATGDVVRFDRALHQSIGADIAEGTPVQLVAPGARIHVGREVLTQHRARVQTTDLPITEAGPAPVVPPAPVSRAPLAIQQRQDALRQAAARPVTQTRQMGGESAYTRRVEHEGGPPTITKDTTRTGAGKAEAKRDADAEELGALVGDAVGLRTPAVIRTGPSSVEMEFIEGLEGGGPWRPEMPYWQDTDQGRLMGLLDIITGNPDRSSDNWLLLPDGRMASIDMGAAFRAPKLAGARDLFGSYFAPEGPWRRNIDIAPEDLAVIHARLEGLRPEFERLGRGAWHRQVMARLAEVEKRADPNAAIRLAEARPDLAAVRKAARAKAATITTQRANASLIARIDELVQAKASKAVIRQELDPALREAEQLYAGADDAMAQALQTAVDSGDATKIRAALTRQSKASGLTPIGKAGAKAKFDPATMEAVGGTVIPDGADVIVVRRGARISGLETPEKAVVRLAPPPSTAKTVAKGDFTGLTRVSEPLGGNPAAIGRSTPGVPYAARQAEVEQLAKRKPTDTRQLGGGATARTELEEFAGDQRAVRKTYGVRSPHQRKSDIGREADAEELAPEVVDAFGVRSAAVTRTGKDQILMEFVDGKTVAEEFPGYGYGTADQTLKISRPFTESDDGRLLGLADYIMGMGDRNEGNWIYRIRNGRVEITAIDHGFAFLDQRGLRPQSNFFSDFLQDEHNLDLLRSTIDVNPADLRVIRDRLEHLRQRFAEAGRKSWHDGMMRRLKALEQRADPNAPIRLAIT